MSELWGFLASNTIIQGFAIFILLITLMAIILVFRRGPGHPWVGTIAEMLPVLGLMGTFLGAFLVFTSKSEERLEGIVVAFFVSFLGWACYVLLHAVATWRSAAKTEAERPSPAALRLHEFTADIGQSLEGVNAELSRVERHMQNIDSIIQSDSIAAMAQGVNTWNQQLERLSGNIGRYNELMAGLKRLADLDVEIGIKETVDLDGLTVKIRRLNEALNSLTGAEKKFQFKVDFTSNYDQVDVMIARVASALKTLEAANRQFAIDIKMPENTSQAAADVEKLYRILRDMEKVPKEHAIQVSWPEDVESKTQAVSRLVSVIKDLSETNKELKVAIDLPVETQKAAAELEKLGSVLHRLESLSKKYELDIQTPEDLPAKTASLSELTSVLTALNQANKTVKVEVDMPFNSQRATIEIGQLIEVLRGFEAIPKDYDIRVGMSDGLEGRAVMVMDLARSLRELQKSTGDYRINVDLPANTDRTASDLNKLIDSLRDLGQVNKDHTINLAISDNLASRLADLEKVETTLEKILDNLKEINHIPKEHQVALDLPPNIGEVMERLTEMRDLFESMPRRQREVSYKIALDGQVETITRQLKEMAAAFKPLAEMEENILLRVGLEVPPDLNQTLEQIKALPALIDNFQTVTKSLEGKMSLDYHTRTTLAELRELVDELMTLRVTREPERGKLSSMVQRIKKPFGSTD